MKILIVGCGVMGQAMAKCLSPKHALFLYDRNKQKVERLEKEGYGQSHQDFDTALNQSEVIILAVKPQALEPVIPLLKAIKPKQIIISILSGTTLETLKKTFSHKKIVRMMPNLALLHGESATALIMDEDVESQEEQKVKEIGLSFGKIYEIDEKNMNAFTSLAGSGPAFVFALIEAMIEAGICMGINAATSKEIIQQMIHGSLSLLEQENLHPSALKWQICSPNGTTIAGLKSFEEFAVRAGIMNTFLAASERANELSK